MAPYPSAGNFLFVPLPAPAEAVSDALLAHGVIVKPWREPGFTHCLRVTIGSPADNDHFLDALDAVFAGARHGLG